MNVLVVGGSRNIGCHAAQRLLASGSTVTFLLRNTSAFDNDEAMKPFISSGKAKLVSGDALNESDVKAAWETASSDDRPVDILLFALGAPVGKPTKLSITKGIIIKPINLCSACMLNVLSTMPTTAVRPKVILISSTGLTKSSRARLPLPLRPMYAHFLRGPHADKLGMERIISHAAGWTWPQDEPEPATEILPEGWQSRLPGESGYLKSVLIVRPALLTHGECKADSEGACGKKGVYRVENDELANGYSISRRDVAHFIVEDALANWSKWEGKCARLAY